MQIVACQPHHSAALKRIYTIARRSAFTWVDRDRFTNDDFQRDTKGELLLVACFDNEPVGFIGMWVPGNFIHHLYVLPESHAKGVGTSLLAAGIAELELPVQLKCLENNAHAIDFYKLRGWRVIESGHGGMGIYLLMQFDGGTNKSSSIASLAMSSG